MSAFDGLASTYDTIFTESSIGILQRAVVHQYLQKAINWPLNSILEIGCGTGADLKWFVERSRSIEAFDISKAMIDQAQRKISKSKHATLYQADLHEWIGKPTTSKYDLIFSNFGVLNCLPPSALQALQTKCVPSLHDSGSLILVLMPQDCLFEKIYFTLTGKWSKINRRTSPLGTVAKLPGDRQQVWYYNPDFIRQCFPDLQMVQVIPVGMAIPPSYLQALFDKRPLLLNGLTSLDKALRKISLLGRYADHYLIHLVKK